MSVTRTRTTIGPSQVCEDWFLRLVNGHKLSSDGRGVGFGVDRYLARSRWIVAVALGFTCLGCLGLLWIRQGTTRTAGMGSLVWNLFLAAVPFP